MGVSARRKSKSKKATGEKGKRVHKKIPGFDAFSKDPVQEVVKMKKKWNGKSVKKIKAVEVGEVVEPEVGIHSVAWAKDIETQPSCGFLKLPYEVRLKIYRHAIDDFEIGNKYSISIVPRKKGKKFISEDWKDSSGDTERLYMLCRQSYVDVVGSGLLYQQRDFSFTSPQTMLNYLLVIHPFHLSQIRSISLDIHILHPPRTICPLALSTLSSLPNLKTLRLHFIIRESLFVKSVVPNSQWYFPRRYQYATPDRFLDRFVNCKDLVGDGKEGGKGGIKGLERLWVMFRSDGPLDWVSGEEEKFASVEEALRRVMVQKEFWRVGGK